MISPITFGSTYKINLNRSQMRDFDGQKYNLLDFCDKKDIKYTSEYKYKNGKAEIIFNERNFPKKQRQLQRVMSGIEHTIFAPDCFDSRIENICNYYNIKFEKLNTDEITSPKAIAKRILPAPEGYTLAYLDIKALDELLKDQYDNNFSHCENDHIVFYGEKTEEIMKSGDKFAAPTLYITYSGANQTLKEYVDKYGVNNLNPGSVSFWLSQRTDNPDHCMFFEMKYLPLSEIPVYLNKESFDNAKALGLIK